MNWLRRWVWKFSCSPDFHNPDTGTELFEYPRDHSLSLSIPCAAQQGAFHAQLPLLPGTPRKQQAGKSKIIYKPAGLGERAAGTCCSSPCTNPLNCILCPCTSTAMGNGALAIRCLCITSAEPEISPKSKKSIGRVTLPADVFKEGL